MGGGALPAVLPPPFLGVTVNRVIPTDVNLTVPLAPGRIVELKVPSNLTESEWSSALQTLGELLVPMLDLGVTVTTSSTVTLGDEQWDWTSNENGAKTTSE